MKFKYQYKCKALTMYSALLLTSMAIMSCKKYVTVDTPTTSTSSENVYKNDATATAVLNGIYIKISSTGLASQGFASLTLYSGLAADELELWSGSPDNTLIDYYQNNLTASGTGGELWNTIYPFIFTCNSAIEGVASSQTLTPKVKSQLLGEAQFMRAFFYYYLTNLYGDVPLVLSKDYVVTSNLPRTSKEKVYQQIIADLHASQMLLSTNFVKPDLITTTTERVRPTKWAATALLARAYLFSGNWSGADSAATAVINNSMFSLASLSGTNKVFNKNSSEAIWQLQPVNSGWNTEEARIFILPQSGPGYSQPVSLSSFLINAFEANDQRRTKWIDSVDVGGVKFYYPSKYKANDDPNVTNGTGSMKEYLMVLRLAEQYLIRAEAKVQLNNISEAQSDLNMVRTRAGLPNTSASDKSTLLAVILHERQVELFTEWGHRWIDMKRMGVINSIMNSVAPLKGGTWSSNKQLFPIPAFELSRNSNLTQNSGY
jgi:hypothetical protein